MINRPMQRRRFVALSVLATVAVGAAFSPAEARQGSGGGGDTVRRTIPLVATAAGTQLTLKGEARTEVRADRDREKVTVEVESHTMTPGQSVDVYAVNAANSSAPLFLGTLTLQPNPARRDEVRGELELTNYDGGSLPVGLSPVGSISEVRVTAAGNAATVLLSSSATPGGGNPQPRRRRISLTPTSAGAAARIKGKAEIETRVNGRQKFKVEVESGKLPAGTVLEIRFTHSTNSGGPYPAGQLTLNARRRAEVEFKNYDGKTLPTGADPVNGITTVSVFTLAGEVLLTGAF